MLSPRGRVETVLRGGCSDVVPFTVYDNLLPRCSAERALRNAGLCSVVRMPVFKVFRPDVIGRREVAWEGGKKLVRTFYSTPQGDLSMLSAESRCTTWTIEHMFKGKDDYAALRFFLSNERYEPDYPAFSLAEKRFGEDGIFRAGFGSEPLQSLISGHFFSTEDFCIEWMDNRDEILALYDITVENRRRVYPIVACSPALHANYGGNVVPGIIGPDNFRRYYIPHYNEAAEAMHSRGKFIGSHFDADCGTLAGMIAESGLDYIEAFTPAPDTDMTLEQARGVWEGKVIWLNFPSSVHICDDAKVEKTAEALLYEAGSPQGLIMGITEDVPGDRWQGSFSAIMRGLHRHASREPGLYGRDGTNFLRKDGFHGSLSD